MRPFWVVVDRLLIGLTAIAALYFLKAGRAYVSFPSAHRTELTLAAAFLALAAILKWVLGATLLGSEDWHVLPCGGQVSARKPPDDGQEVECSLGHKHDRAELGQAASAARAYAPKVRAWITVSQLLLAMSAGAWLGSLMGLGLAGQGVLIAVLLGAILAFKSRSTGAKWAAGVAAVCLVLFLVRDAIDWEDWGEPIVVLLAIPFAMMSKNSDDD